MSAAGADAPEGIGSDPEASSSDSSDRKREGGNGSRLKPEEGTQRGVFVISLDFEQIWGIRHLSRLSKYMAQLSGTRSVVLSLLDIFRDYEIHATWAVVGFLFADNGIRLRQILPKIQPQYADRRLSPYLDLPPRDSRETSDAIYFAPSLIRQIAQVPNQEIGTHTLSHYYCLEPGQDAKAFRADLTAAIAVGRQFGIELKSLVFPKNQCRADFLEVCAESGILAYRGTPGSWLYRANPDRKKQSPLRRLARLLDSYLPISPGLTAGLPLEGGAVPIDVPASRFLRAYMPVLRAFEPFKLSRIRREMTRAAKSGRMYHLWWHPHDFGVETEINLRFLRRILDHFRSLHAAYGMESVNMAEAAAKALSLKEGYLAQPKRKQHTNEEIPSLRKSRSVDVRL